MYQICVSGSAKGESVELGKNLAHDSGLAIAKGGHTLLTGATSGLPLIAAQAYKQAGGAMSLGISPARTKIEHVVKYRLPIRPYDAILYTGMHYVGRDAFLINSADAVISIGGRLGTLHEAVIALETDTPIGFLLGAGGTTEFIDDILKAAGRESNRNVIFSDNSDDLLNRLIQLMDVENARYPDIYA